MCIVDIETRLQKVSRLMSSGFSWEACNIETLFCKVVKYSLESQVLNLPNISIYHPPPPYFITHYFFKTISEVGLQDQFKYDWSKKVLHKYVVCGRRDATAPLLALILLWFGALLLRCELRRSALKIYGTTE